MNNHGERTIRRWSKKEKRKVKQRRKAPVCFYCVRVFAVVVDLSVGCCCCCSMSVTVATAGFCVVTAVAAVAAEAAAAAAAVRCLFSHS